MSNKKFGYARVSTAEQNEDRQVLELLEYGIEERDIYVDKQSGRSFERTNYMSLRNSILRNGDILVVKSMFLLMIWISLRQKLINGNVKVYSI